MDRMLGRTHFAWLNELSIAEPGAKKSRQSKHTQAVDVKKPMPSEVGSIMETIENAAVRQ